MNRTRLPKIAVMDLGVLDVTTEEMIREIENLEDIYAEALKDEMDAVSLNRIWSQIKALKKELYIKLNS